MQVVEDNGHERGNPVAIFQPKCMIEGTSSSINIGTGFAKTTLIAECVNRYIHELLSQVGQDYPEFKVSELLQVGSYKEGTKILSPDEFDFLAVIDSLSEPGCVSVEKAEPTMHHPNAAGLVKVRVAPEYMETWGKYHHEGYLRCFQKSEKYTTIYTHETFGTIVVKTIAKMAHREGKETLIDANLALTIVTNSMQYHRSVFETKEVQLKSADVNHPNILLSFITENRRITADLCPAIRYTKLEECFDEKLCASKEISDSVKKHGSVLLVGRLNCDFRITFTEVEVDYMRRKLHKNHKLIYIYLKYVNHLIAEKRKFTWFTSYMFKTVIIHHDIHCSDEGKTTHHCFGEILDLLDEFTEKLSLPMIFNADVNLLHDATSTDLDNTLRKLQLVALRDLREMSKEGENIDTHIADIRKIVEALVEEFNRSLHPPKPEIPRTFRQTQQE